MRFQGLLFFAYVPLQASEDWIPNLSQVIASWSESHCDHAIPTQLAVTLRPRARLASFHASTAHLRPRSPRFQQVIHFCCLHISKDHLSFFLSCVAHLLAALATAHYFALCRCSIEQFCQWVCSTNNRLDIIINNACQTVRRPTAYYKHLIQGETQAPLQSITHQVLSSCCC
jgi:hypothetical protein